MRTVTLDTNTVDFRQLVDVARAAGFELVHTTVTDREIEGSNVRPASLEAARIKEPFVLGETPWSVGVLGSDSESRAFENLLQIISNGSFPPIGRRDSLSSGQQRQLRDAMILMAHIREGRDVLVTNDIKGFIADGRRERIEKESGTKIMTAEEFLNYCDSRRGGHAV